MDKIKIEMKKVKSPEGREVNVVQYIYVGGEEGNTQRYARDDVKGTYNLQEKKFLLGQSIGWYDADESSVTSNISADRMLTSLHNVISKTKGDNYLLEINSDGKNISFSGKEQARYGLMSAFGVPNIVLIGGCFAESMGHQAYEYNYDFFSEPKESLYSLKLNSGHSINGMYSAKLLYNVKRYLGENKKSDKEVVTYYSVELVEGCPEWAKYTANDNDIVVLMLGDCDLHAFADPNKNKNAEDFEGHRKLILNDYNQAMKLLKDHGLKVMFVATPVVEDETSRVYKEYKSVGYNVTPDDWRNANKELKSMAEKNGVDFMEIPSVAVKRSKDKWHVDDVRPMLGYVMRHVFKIYNIKLHPLKTLIESSKDFGYNMQLQRESMEAVQGLCFDINSFEKEGFDSRDYSQYFLQNKNSQTSIS